MTTFSVEVWMYFCPDVIKTFFCTSVCRQHLSRHGRNQGGRGCHFSLIFLYIWEIYVIIPWQFCLRDWLTISMRTFVTFIPGISVEIIRLAGLPSVWANLGFHFGWRWTYLFVSSSRTSHCSWIEWHMDLNIFISCKCSICKCTQVVMEHTTRHLGKSQIWEHFPEGSTPLPP